MNKTIFVLLGLYSFLAQGIYSQPVSMELAQRVAENFFLTQSPSKSILSMQVSRWGDREQPTLYAFSLSDCWVLVSGDKRTQPILAYSEQKSQKFPSAEEMPEGMSFLLECYNEQVEALRNEAIKRNYNLQWDLFSDTTHRVSINRSVIVAPLLERNGNENIWRQIGNNTTGVGSQIAKSYNKFCPPANNNSYDCDNTPVGCVALATGQVMWYWQWPHAAVVQDSNHNPITRILDWNEMPYKLTNSSSLVEADMIANLLHDIGILLNMTYTCGGSHTSSSNISPVLRSNYLYHADSLRHRKYYSDSIWIELMKNELNESRPIIYGGHSSNVGHEFVVDGYNSDNYFHANMGGSFTDGYYNLSFIILSQNQSMIINIYPQYPSCSPLVIPYNDVWNTKFEIQNGGSITIGNRTISANQQGVIYSGESIHLTNGFHVERGANVHIAIRDMHCQRNSTSNRIKSLSSTHSQVGKIIDSTHFHKLILSPNPATDILEISSTELISHNTIYTLTGQPVLQTTDTEINVSAFPAGMYIVRAITTTGEQLQSKFIKQ